MSEENDNNDPLLSELSNHTVSACVKDIDHHHEGVMISSEYIIEVASTEGESPTFATFRISKRYSAFRELANKVSQCTNASHSARKATSQAGPETMAIINFAIKLNRTVNEVSVSYFGKMTYKTVKSQSKRRQAVIDQALDLIVSNFPSKDLSSSNPVARTVSSTLETFFLTDFIIDEEHPHAAASRKHHHRLSKDMMLFAKNKVMSKTSLGTKKSSIKALEYDYSSTTSDAPPKSSTPLIAKAKPQSLEEIHEDHDTTTTNNDDNNNNDADIVRPRSFKKRASLLERKEAMEKLESFGESEKPLLTDDHEMTLPPPPMVQKRVPVGVTGDDDTATSRTMSYIVANPALLLVGSITYILCLKSLSSLTLEIPGDVSLLICLAFYFCGGHYFPRRRTTKMVTMTVDTAVTPRSLDDDDDEEPKVAKSPKKQMTRRESMEVRDFLAKSFLPPTPRRQTEDSSSELVEGEEYTSIDMSNVISPLPVFPEGGDPAVNLNCVSEPDFRAFMVRGGNYLKDKKKVASGPYIFPFRGVDLFLTDSCPENIGRNQGLLGGKMRDLPTFIVNFRLPWGVCVFMFEIPSKFLPFLHKGYEPNPSSTPTPSMDDMTPAERLTCQFLMGDSDFKNRTLKIVPVVIIGPWIVKSVVGGKPAIVGTKMPLHYVYQPPQQSLGRAEYLEADLDIVASSAARGILSVVRSHTKHLTLDLGFVIQGNKEDELPEQMLTGTRLHGIDPGTASHMPPMPDCFPLGLTELDHSSTSSLPL